MRCAVCIQQACSLYQHEPGTLHTLLLQQKISARSKLITEAVKHTPAVVNKCKYIFISNKPPCIAAKSTVNLLCAYTNNLGHHQAVRLLRNNSYSCTPSLLEIRITNGFFLMRGFPRFSCGFASIAGSLSIFTTSYFNNSMAPEPVWFSLGCFLQPGLFR